MEGNAILRNNRVCLSFDDGRMDNYTNVIPILERYGLKGTFNITTAYIDGTIPTEYRPCKNDPMTIEQIREIYAAGHEIAAHGDCHRNDIEDIIKGIEKLRDWGVAGMHIGFASPNSQITEEEIYAEEAELKNLGVEYVRIGIPPGSQLRRLIRLGARITRNSFLFRQGVAWKEDDMKSNFIIHSVPIMRYATVKQVEKLVERMMKRDSVCTLMFHSIQKPDDEYYNDVWSWDISRFETLCKWIAKKCSVVGESVNVTN